MRMLLVLYRPSLLSVNFIGISHMLWIAAVAVAVAAAAVGAVVVVVVVLVVVVVVVM